MSKVGQEVHSFKTLLLRLAIRSVLLKDRQDGRLAPAYFRLNTNISINICKQLERKETTV